MIGWITISYFDEDLMSIGIYVEPPELGEVASSFQMTGHRTYEIESAVLQAFSDTRFNKVEWWAYSPDTWAEIRMHMPHLADFFTRVESASGLFRLFEIEEETEMLLPLEHSYNDLETYRAIEGAVNMVGADLTNRIGGLLS